MIKRLILIFVSIILAGCTTESKSLKELNKVYNSYNISKVKTNKELNKIYIAIQETTGNEEDYKERKEEINMELENRAIEIWENTIVNAIQDENYKNYFDYRESIAYKSYYYWHLSDVIGPFDYPIDSYNNYEYENGLVVASDKLCFSNKVINNTYIGDNVADKRFEQIYYLELFRYEMFNNHGKTISDLDDTLLGFAQNTMKRINPNYSGLMSENMQSWGIQLFGNKDEWQKQYNEAISKGQTPYFMELEDIEKAWHENYSDEEISQAKQSEIDKLKNNKLLDEYFKQIQEYNDKLSESRPQVGMTEKEVLASRWGKPDHINTTENEYGKREQWCYSGNRYVYLKNGVVTSVSY